jgi:hypothetical protein
LGDLEAESLPKERHMISTSSIVVAAKDQVSSDLGEEVAILNLKNGVYYGLDAVGARIWSLIQEPRTVNEILDVLLDEYEVEPERCERDLLTLLEELVAENLVEARDGPDS